MSLQMSLPFGKKESVKNLAFSILTYEYPLKLIDLTNLLRKRHGRSVTFQAVRKAVLELVDEGVVIKEGVTFSINKEWIKKSKEVIDKLYAEIYQGRHKSQKIDSIGQEVSVFTFGSINEMMQFWQDLVKDWFDKLKPEDYKINCWQGAHIWEGVLHPDREKRAFDQLHERKVKSYALIMGTTPLDQSVFKFYEKIGIKTKIKKPLSSFDKSYYVGTYGDLVVQSRYPEETVKLLDNFFKKNKKLNELDIGELSEIVNKKIETKLTVIRDQNMAKQISQSIISQM